MAVILKNLKNCFKLATRVQNAVVLNTGTGDIQLLLFFEWSKRILFHKGA